jgi:hypothetical protein
MTLSRGIQEAWDPPCSCSVPSRLPRNQFFTYRPGKISCFETQTADNEFWSGTLNSYPPGFDVRGNLTLQSDLNYFNSQVPVMEERWKAFGQVCINSKDGSYLPYVGTAATARDMVALADYLDGKDSPVNYWGKCCHSSRCRLLIAFRFQA